MQRSDLQRALTVLDASDRRRDYPKSPVACIVLTRLSSFEDRWAGSKLANARSRLAEKKEEDIVENKKQTASREQARKREAFREALARAHKGSDCQRFPISPG